MAAGTAVSRVLGLTRSLVLIAALGATGVAADTFDTANKIPNILYMLLAGGVLNAVLVPQIVRATRSDGGQQYVNRLITLSVTLLAAATVVLTLASPVLVHLYSTTRSAAWHGLATAFAFWCIPQVFFYGLYTVLGQVLNAKGRFGAYMWAPVANNVVAILGLAAFIVIYGPSGAGRHDLNSWHPRPVLAVMAFRVSLAPGLGGARGRVGQCRASCRLDVRGRGAGSTRPAGDDQCRQSGGRRQRGHRRRTGHRRTGRLHAGAAAVHAAALPGGGVAGHRAVHQNERGRR
jgi:hypothetical protein